MILDLYNERVKVVVDIDPSFQSSMSLVITLAPSFLDMTTLHIRMISMLYCRILLQGTYPIFNSRNIDSACKIPSKILLVTYHTLFVGGLLRVHGPAFPVGRRALNVGHCT